MPTASKVDNDSITFLGYQKEIPQVSNIWEQDIEEVASVLLEPTITYSTQSTNRFENIKEALNIKKRFLNWYFDTKATLSLFYVPIIKHNLALVKEGASKSVLLTKIIPFWWFGISGVFSIFLTTYALINLDSLVGKVEPKYSTYSSKPKVAGIATQNLESGDARAARINAIFSMYECPIQGKGDVFVKEADKNNIPYWLVASVAFQESTCGKYTPYINGAPTHNLYGWGVWGDNVAKFDTLDEGIEVVSEYMNKRFYSQGITEPCDIMKVYTPPSQGSWCEGVKFFRDKITQFEGSQQN
ncbi:MAG: hypothetical protein R3B92_00390 [Patescibacteria group bacterium]